MNVEIIITVHGVDRGRCLESLQTTATTLGANVLESKFIRLDTLMSALLKVNVPAGAEEKFRSNMDATFPDMQLSYVTVSGRPASVSAGEAALSSVCLVIDCKSRPGLQQELETVLQNLNFRVEHIAYRRCRVAHIGETMLSTECVLALPEHIDPEDAATEIETLVPGSRVNVAAAVA